jgi:hypothetical protein
LSLILGAASARGWDVRRSVGKLVLRRGADRFECRWPAAPDPSKLHLPRLVAGLSSIGPCPTKLLPASPAPALWLPGCVKPSRGTNGAGFRVFSSERQWSAIWKSQARDERTMVVQPFLGGQEYRVTVTRTGDFAVAALLGRRGRLTRWRDATRGFAPGVIEDVWRIGQRCASPVIGADVLVGDTGAVLIDVNLGPSIAIHLMTDRPRELAPAVLAAWLDMKAAKRRAWT